MEPLKVGREHPDVLDVDAHDLDRLMVVSGEDHGVDPKGQAFGFAPSCHPQRAVKVMYRYGTGKLILTCPDCGELVATVRVSR